LIFPHFAYSRALALCLLYGGDDVTSDLAQAFGYLFGCSSLLGAVGVYAHFVQSSASGSSSSSRGRHCFPHFSWIPTLAMLRAQWATSREGSGSRAAGTGAGVGVGASGGEFNEEGADLEHGRCSVGGSGVQLVALCNHDGGGGDGGACSAETAARGASSLGERATAQSSEFPLLCGDADDEEAADDADVRAAARHVRSGCAEASDRTCVLLEKFVRIYPAPFSFGGRAQPAKVAVGGVDLAIDFGECFGLLGPNGAGKTTLLETLSGLAVPQRGRALVAGIDLAASGLRKKALGVLGVCPQFDVVWSELTVRDHLLLYARLKGVPSLQQAAASTAAASKVGLDGDAFGLKAKELSGGMRRRLSLAAALVGDPKVLILDEPTTGLDPDTRRQIWEIVNKEKRSDRTIILTTHSMEEADTLCTRIGIMAAGRLRALGTAQHLKSRYGTGFHLDVTMKAPGIPPPDEFVSSFCNSTSHGNGSSGSSSSDNNANVCDSGGCGCDSVEKSPFTSAIGDDETAASKTPKGFLVAAPIVGKQVGCVIKYELPKGCFDPAEALSALQSSATRNGISVWSLTQPSLEEVFINIANRYTRD